MLARTQVPRLVDVLSSSRCHQRALVSTKASKTKRSQGGSPIPHKVGKTSGLPNRSALVRFSSVLGSPFELYTMVRELEKRYGAIRDYYALPDFEVTTKYQNTLYVSFRDPEAFERIPSKEPDTFQVTLPRTAPQEGGPSLDELAPLLVRREYEEPSQKKRLVMSDLVSSIREEQAAKQKTVKDTERVIDVNVRRSDRERWVLPPPAPQMSRQRLVNQGQLFLKWGGFNTLDPIPFHDPLPKEPSLFDPDVRPDFARRRAFRNYADLLRIKNPHEIYPNNEVPPDYDLATAESATRQDPEESVVREDPEDLWEPLPGTEHLTHDDAPMPSDLEFDEQSSHLSNAPPYAVPTSTSSAPTRPPASSPQAGRLKEFMGWR